MMRMNNGNDEQRIFHPAVNFEMLEFNQLLGIILLVYGSAQSSTVEVYFSKFFMRNHLIIKIPTGIEKSSTSAMELRFFYCAKFQ
jgi:hypothetical protein